VRVSSRIGPQTSSDCAQPLAQQRVDACEQLLDVERLHDVIVGAELQGLDLVLPAVACREHEDRVRLAVGTHLLDELDAGNRRQAEIDNREVDRILLRVVETFAAVLGSIDRVACLLELSRERLIQSLIVFDEQNTHRKSPERTTAALVHGARARVDRYVFHAAVVADDPDLVHRAVTLLDRLRAHDTPRITVLRELDRFGERELATLRQLRLER
jgi:hypothetical protein